MNIMKAQKKITKKECQLYCKHYCLNTTLPWGQKTLCTFIGHLNNVKGKYFNAIQYKRLFSINGSNFKILPNYNSL